MVNANVGRMVGIANGLYVSTIAGSALPSLCASLTPGYMYYTCSTTAVDRKLFNHVTIFFDFKTV